MKIHIVKKGDTLYELSQKYEVELDKLIAFNPQIANPDVLDIGMKIKIPSESKPAVPPNDYLYKHMVVQGDTLWKLGKAWSVPLADMVAANPQLKNPNVLMTGDVVYIPKQKSVHAGHGESENQANASNLAGAGHKANTSVQMVAESVEENAANELPPKIDTSAMPMTPLPVEATPVSELPPAPVVPAPVPMKEEPVKAHEPVVLPNVKSNVPPPVLPEMTKAPNLNIPYGQTEAGNLPPAKDLFAQFQVPATKAGDVPFSPEPELPVFPNMPIENMEVNAAMHGQHAPYPFFPGLGANAQVAGGCGCGQPNLPYALSPSAEYPNAAPNAYPSSAISPAMGWPNAYQPNVEYPSNFPNVYQPSAVSPAFEQPNAYQPSAISPAFEHPNAYQPSAVSPAFEHPNAYNPSAISPAFEHPNAYNPSAISPAFEHPNAYNPSAISPAFEHPNAYHPSAVSPAFEHPNAYQPSAVSPVSEFPNAYNPSAVSPAFEHPNAYNPSAVSPAFEHPNAYQPSAVSPAFEHPNAYYPSAVSPAFEHPNAYYPSAVSPAFEHPNAYYPSAVSPAFEHPNAYYPSAVSPAFEHPNAYYPNAVSPAFEHPNAYYPSAVSPAFEHPNAYYPSAVSPAFEHPNAYYPSAVSPAFEHPNAYYPSAVSPAFEHPNAYYPSAVSPAFEHPNAYYPSAVSPAFEQPNAFNPSVVSPVSESPNAFQPTAVSPMMEGLNVNQPYEAPRAEEKRSAAPAASQGNASYGAAALLPQLTAPFPNGQLATINAYPGVGTLPFTSTGTTEIPANPIAPLVDEFAPKQKESKAKGSVKESSKTAAPKSKARNRERSAYDAISSLLKQNRRKGSGGAVRAKKNNPWLSS
ncbi:LysM peptidoglycan-binding domain-containing protein [Paenibacillus puerhi]|uniref:LysM peptidoglycan-binding domain-containing protein n=1 Tax=Paenibacillus puerhi TaxID=2692622 RepID=UPI00135BA33E|nr:LysM peptidoglycan-binding domain-containing protein [Paenibacillus puerhi]